MPRERTRTRRRARIGLSMGLSLAMVTVLAVGPLACADQVETGTVALSVQPLETESTQRSRVTSFTPTSFQLPVTEVVLFQEGSNTVWRRAYYDSKSSLIEFATSSAAPVLTANQAVPVGTYDRMEVGAGGLEGPPFVVAGCASLDGVRHCTRTDRTEPAAVMAGEAPQPVEILGANTIVPVLGEALEVQAGDVIDLNLYYDVTGAVTFQEVGFDANGAVTFGDGTGIQVKYPPFFAFIGEPPPVEIYELTLVSDPNPSQPPNLEAWFPSPDKWHVRMWMFFDDAGDPVAARDVWISDDGADGQTLVSMFGTDDLPVSNGDGTYRMSIAYSAEVLMGWRIVDFERATHDGSVVFTNQEGSKTFGYHVERLQ